MLNKQKKLIYFITGYTIIAAAVGLILVLAFDRNDLLPVTFIVATVLILLFINMRASHFSRIKYTKQLNKEKLDEEELKAHSLGTKILFGYFLIMTIISIVSAIITY